MVQRGTLLIAATFILALAAGASGQRITNVEAVVEPEVTVRGEPALYKVKVEVAAASGSRTPPAAPPAPMPPASDNYELTFQGTQSGNFMSSTQIINGRVTHSTTMTFMHVFLIKPKVLSASAVDSYTFEAYGETYRVPPAPFRVEKDLPGNQYAALVVTASTLAPYVNQPVRLRFELKTEKRMVSKPRVDVPWAASPNGFFAEPLPQPKAPSSRQYVEVLLNGEPFAMRFDRPEEGGESEMLFLERTVYPIAPGKVEIPASVASVELATRYQRDFFRQLVPVESVRAAVSAPALLLEVRDAPANGRPPSYAGLIGDFRCEIRYGKTDIRAGDGVTLTLTIRGDGDLESIAPPLLPDMPNCDIYPPDKQIARDGDAKSLNVSWLIIPRAVENVVLPKVEFSWFQPSSAAFQTVAAGPAPVAILGALRDEGVFGGARSADDRPAIRTLSEGVRPIKIRPGTLGRTGSAPPYWLIALALILPPASYAFVRRIVAHRRHVAGDETVRRRLRASKEATARLVEAHRLIGQGANFWSKLARSLSGFIADKRGLPPASVSPATVSSVLMAAGVPGEVIDDVARTMDHFDGLQYGGGAPTEAERSEAYARVEKLIHRLDRVMKG